MSHIISKAHWSILWLCGLVVLMVIIAGCGGVTTSPGGSTGTGSANSTAIPPGVPSSNNQGQSKSSASGRVQQYLIKTLNISMEVKDTQKVAADLQAWISATDPLSTATNIQDNQVGDNLYPIFRSLIDRFRENC